MQSALSFLTQRSDARTGRMSSWDHSGRNQDYWTLGPHETRVLADLEGPGQITHIWMTQFCNQNLGPSMIDPFAADFCAPAVDIPPVMGVHWEVTDPDYYRKVLIRITWDDEPEPAVLVPLGDFFGVGHSMPNSYASALFTVSSKPDQSFVFGGGAALNSWVPMPFNRRAVIELVNENDLALSHFFYIDYELFRRPASDETLYFHAAWNRNNPCAGWGPDLQVNSPETNTVANFTGDGNYVILETQGAGHYVGCNLSVYMYQNSWFGEGNDMIFVDDDEAPSIWGTGCEDYFNHAWGMQKNAFPYHGTIIHKLDVPRYFVTYRFHIVDPVRFTQRIRVTLEHGQGNHLADDWASTAYWYQTLPSPKASILPVELRLPTRATPPSPPSSTGGPGSEPSGIPAKREQYFTRLSEYEAKLADRTEQRIGRSRVRAEENKRLAAELRARFPTDS